MKKSLYLVCLLVLAGAVSGTVGHEEVEVDLEDNSMNIDLHINELTASQLTYVTSYPVEDLESSINREDADCSVEDLQIGAEISCNTNFTEDFNASFSFETEGLTSHQGRIEKFQYTRAFRVPTDNYTLRVILPKSSTIVNDENLSQPAISPGSGEVETDGRRIYVEWRLNPTIGGEPNNFHVLYSYSDNTSQIVLYIVAIGLLLGLMASGYVLWQRVSRQSIDTIYPELGEDEIDVLKVIESNGGEMLQKDVVSESEYSKAKISGVVSGLVEKEVLVKEKEGRSNKLSISQRFKLS